MSYIFTSKFPCRKWFECTCLFPPPSSGVWEGWSKVWIVIATVLFHYFASFLSVCLPWILWFLVLYVAAPCAFAYGRWTSSKTAREDQLPNALSPYFLIEDQNWNVVWGCGCALSGTVLGDVCLKSATCNHGNNSRALVLGIDPRRNLQRVLGLLCQIVNVDEVFIWSGINRAFKYRLGRETLALGKELGAYFCYSLRDIYFL